MTDHTRTEKIDGDSIFIFVVIQVERETVMTASKEEKQKKVDILSWRENDLTHLDPRTPECEKEVYHIIYLQEIANRLPNAFNDAAKITKSHIPTVNTPAWIYVPEEHKKMDENVPRQKRGRPIGSKDAAPRKKRGRN